MGHLSTRQIADILGVETWRVRRLFEDGTLPEPARFCGKRAIPATSIQAIADSLFVRGWLVRPRLNHARR